MPLPLTAIAEQVAVEPVVAKSAPLSPVTDSLNTRLYEIEVEFVSVVLGAKVVTDGGITKLITATPAPDRYPPV
jgi:hypothetical protein